MSEWDDWCRMIDEAMNPEGDPPPFQHTANITELHHLVRLVGFMLAKEIRGAVTGGDVMSNIAETDKLLGLLLRRLARRLEISGGQYDSAAICTRAADRLDPPKTEGQ